MSNAFKHRPWSVAAATCALILLGAVLGQGVIAPSTAHAQIPDSGAQFNEMIVELKGANQKLTEVVGLLKEIRDAQAAEKGEKKDKGAKKP